MYEIGLHAGLKSCPFCGNFGIMKVNAQTLNCSVTCKNCGVVMKKNFKGNKKVEKLLIQLMEAEWNKRVN